MFAEFEVPVLFDQFLHDAPLRIPGTIGIAVLLGQEGFLLHRIETGVGRLVEVSRRMEAIQQDLDDLPVTGIGGADEVVVTQAEGLDEGAPLDGQTVAIGLRRLAQIVGRLLNFLAVLIRARQEEHRLPHASPSPSDDVGHHLFVGVPQVGSPVHIINCCGDVEPLVHVRAIQPENDSKSKGLLESGLSRGQAGRALNLGQPLSARAPDAICPSPRP